jgi:hypothetical protein
VNKFKLIVAKKPLLFLLLSLVYTAGVIFLKWGMHPAWVTLTFLVGSLIGYYFLEIAEEFFALNPSPFRTIVFIGGFAIVSFFIITSSGSGLASGLVLTLYLTLIIWLSHDWQKNGNLNSWYNFPGGEVNKTTQITITIFIVIFFLIETLQFIQLNI